MAAASASSRETDSSTFKKWQLCLKPEDITTIKSDDHLVAVQGVRIQQESFLTNPRLEAQLLKALRAIKNDIVSKIEPSHAEDIPIPSIFISYKWPTRHRHEYWIFEFLRTLAGVHIKTAGIKAYLDIIDSPGDVKIPAFRDLITKVTTVWLICTQSLKDHAGESFRNITKELDVIESRERTEADSSTNFRINVLAGGVESVLPPGSGGIAGIALMGNHIAHEGGYLGFLKAMILSTLRITATKATLPDGWESRLNSIWIESFPDPAITLYPFTKEDILAQLDREIENTHRTSAGQAEEFMAHLRQCREKRHIGLFYDDDSRYSRDEIRHPSAVAPSKNPEKNALIIRYKHQSQAMLSDSDAAVGGNCECNCCCAPSGKYGSTATAQTTCCTIF